MTVDHPCIDVYSPGEPFDPAVRNTAPPAARGGDELALARQYRWQTGQELLIRFLDGDAWLRAEVEDISRQWLEHANLAFTFGDRPVTDVRITFTGTGFRSRIGTSALRLHHRQDTWTMRLGGLGDLEPDQRRRKVLHEFGHAIGCVHEQSSPAAKIPWNVPEVMRYYRQYTDWDDATIRANVLERFSASDVRAGDYDPDSIMHYPVPRFLTHDGFEIGWNSELSAGDKSFVEKLYPRDPDH